MRKGFSLIELLVAITIFSIILSIVLFFYMKLQRIIIWEQERSYLEDIAAVNLNKIRDRILRCDDIIEIHANKMVFQAKSGNRDSIFQYESNVMLCKGRLTSHGIDSIFFFWSEPESMHGFIRPEIDVDGNGILESDELENLPLLSVRYKIARNRYSADLITKIYLRE